MPLTLPISTKQKIFAFRIRGYKPSYNEPITNFAKSRNVAYIRTSYAKGTMFGFVAFKSETTVHNVRAYFKEVSTFYMLPICFLDIAVKVLQGEGVDHYNTVIDAKQLSNLPSDPNFPSVNKSDVARKIMSKVNHTQTDLIMVPRIPELDVKGLLDDLTIKISLLEEKALVLSAENPTSQKIIGCKTNPSIGFVIVTPSNRVLQYETIVSYATEPPTDPRLPKRPRPLPAKVIYLSTSYSGLPFHNNPNIRTVLVDGSPSK